MPHASGNFGPTDPTETGAYSFDFSAALGAGETISVFPGVVWSIGVYSGIDAAAASRLIGSPQITGNISTQMVGNCLAGVTYTLTATATTSAGQIRTVSAEIACIAIW